MNTKKYNPDHIDITDEAHQEVRVEKERLNVPVATYIGALIVTGLKHKEEVNQTVEEMTDAD